jgi:hypothetical protein
LTIRRGNIAFTLSQADAQLLDIHKLYKSGRVDLIQSEDEDGGKPSQTFHPRPRYWYKNAERDSWLNPQVIELHRALDALHMWSRYTIDLRPTPGTYPHIPESRPEEEESPDVDFTITAVPGLPRNYYKDEYYDGLGEDSRRNLKATTAINLKLSPQTQR